MCTHRDPITFRPFGIYFSSTTLNHPTASSPLRSTFWECSNALRNGDRRTFSCVVGGGERSCIFPIGISTDVSMSTCSACSKVFSSSACSAISSSFSSDIRLVWAVFFGRLSSARVRPLKIVARSSPGVCSGSLFASLARSAANY